MAAIFPPPNKGGVPPGPSICNGYTPEHTVIGEGPFYVSPDCTTILTDCQLNALTSEIAAAVDKLGFSYNTSIVTNLGDAFNAWFATLDAKYVGKAGDTMTGPLIMSRDPVEPLEAATKNYAVARGGDTMTGELILPGSPSNLLGAVPKGYVDGAVSGALAGAEATHAALQTDINSRVLRAGDTMTGPLILAKHPDVNLEAATKFYVDNVVVSGGTFIDAPADSKTYGRRNNLWSETVPMAGGTMTGLLVLSGVPSAANGAATKGYVDAVTTAVGTKVNKAGDTMSGSLAVGPAAPGDANAAQVLTNWIEARSFLDNLYAPAAGALKRIAAGFGSNIALDIATGQLDINVTDTTGAAGAAIGVMKRISMLPNGALDVPNGIKSATSANRIKLIGGTGPDNLQYTINDGAVQSVGGGIVSLGGNGYLKLPNGLMLQWGLSTGGGGADEFFVAFPTAFPNACFNAQATVIAPGGTMQLFAVSVSLLSAGGFQAAPRYTDASGVHAAGQQFYWLAVGW